MAYIDSEESTPVHTANEIEKSDQPQIHLSATDGKMVSDATQIVYHKMASGELFIEVFPNESLKKYIDYIQFSLSPDAKKKLIEYLNNTVTY